MTQTVTMTLLAREITYNGIKLSCNPLILFMFAIGMPIAYHNSVIDFKTAKRIILKRYKLNAAEANETTSDLIHNAERLMNYRIRNEDDFIEMLDDLERLGS